jgi:hypothetical protein
MWLTGGERSAISLKGETYAPPQRGKGSDDKKTEKRDFTNPGK